jgi:putative ABC transport system permease protein
VITFAVFQSARPRLAVARATLGGAFSHNRGRMLLSVLALALGVALGFAVALINEAAIGEFAGGIATMSGTADLEVRGPRAGFDEMFFARLAGDPDIAVASPVVEVDARIQGRDDALTILGVDAFRAGAVTPALLPSAADPLDVLRPDAIFLSPAAAAWLSAGPGDVIAVQAGLHDVTLTVAGLLDAPASQRYAVMDIAATQDHFARAGRVTRVDLRVRPGVDVATLRVRWQRDLPAGVAIERPQARADAGTRLSRAYRVNLNVLALVALFTGGLLVFSTQALMVVRRRAQFALLRALGLPRRQLLLLLLVEGGLVGVVGSLLGICAGYGFAAAAMRIFGGDLGAGFFHGVPPSITMDPVAALGFGALGVATATLGCLLPALEAARAAPAAALKAGDEQAAFGPRHRAWPGAFLVVAGALSALLPPVRELPLFGYLAIALMLFGTLLLMPRLCTALLAFAGNPRAVPAALALDQLRGTPGQTTVSLATIVASVSLMVSMAIMVASFRQSLDDWLAQVLPADVYVRSGTAGDSAYFSAEEQNLFATVPGIARVEFLRVQSLLFDPALPRVVLLARDLRADDPARALPLVGEAHPTREGDPPAVWISEAVADRHGYTPGQRIALPIDGRSLPFIVGGIWRDYARQQGAIVLDRAVYSRLTGDTAANDAALWLGNGVRSDDVQRALEDRLGRREALGFTTSGTIRAISLNVFDRTFAVTYALEAAAVGIGLVGLSSSFGALAFARRREFGMLRHLGLTRRQIGAMLATEGLTISGIGLSAGLGLGWLMSLVLIFVVNRQSFHWSMALHVPWQALGTLAIALLVFATLTTLASARYAMGDDVIRTVKDDW